MPCQTDNEKTTPEFYGVLNKNSKLYMSVSKVYYDEHHNMLRGFYVRVRDDIFCIWG